VRVRTLSIVLSTLVSVAALSALPGSRPASADQVSDLQAQATAIAQKVVLEQLQVGAYQQQYSVVSARVSADNQAVAATAQQIATDRVAIAQKTGEVRQQAIRSYLDYGTGANSATSTLFSGSQESAQATSEYTGIAVGNITTAMDQLRTAQGTLEAHATALRQQQAQDQSDEAKQATALSQANGTAQSLATLQSQVTGQLATAVAAQAAARQAAAAAAVAAAQKAAAQQAPVGTSARAPTRSSAPTAGAPSTTATSGAPSAQAPVASGTDPALNPFLQCVVQAESGGDYQIVSANGMYMGAFQFSQSTWNVAAQAAGRPDLVGVPPNEASKADQDTLAVTLYSLDGERPWLGDRCS
jgi:peptidoglycan hydrolase CwlO-like protein